MHNIIFREKENNYKYQSKIITAVTRDEFPKAVVGLNAKRCLHLRSTRSSITNYMYLRTTNALVSVNTYNATC